MKKLLIASGCSFTDEKFVSALHPEMECNWSKWPEILAKKLDMDFINLGQNGAGNEYIYSTLLEEILKQKDKREIGLVIPAWTQCQRKDWQELKSFKWRMRRFDLDGDVFGWLKRTLRYMISLQLICENLNVPLKQFQMISLYDGWISGLGKTDAEVFANKNNPEFVMRYKYPGLTPDLDRKACQQIMIDYEPYINVKDFIGWPLVSEIGGFHIEEKTLQLKEKKYPENYHLNYQSDLLVSKLDVHPNGKGHEKIAEFLYDRLD